MMFLQEFYLPLAELLKIGMTVCIYTDRFSKIGAAFGLFSSYVVCHVASN